MNIVVLAGGLSTERNVSITSGKKVSTALRKVGHNVILLDVFFGCDANTNDMQSMFNQNIDFIPDVALDSQVPNLDEIKASRGGSDKVFFGNNVVEICQYADICFLALHGDVGENGKLQASFDLLGIKYTGSGSLGSAVAMNKGISKSIFLSHNVSTPIGVAYSKEDKLNNLHLNWNTFPCVVKPCSGGSSVGVSIVNDKDEFLSALEESFKYEDEVLIEQFVKGREFSIGVLGGNALPIIEIIPKTGFYDYENKYQAGRTLEVCPAELDEETTIKLQNQAIRAFKALGLESYSRIDFLLDNNGNTYCLEANTLPGMTPISLMPQEAAAVGISYEQLCDKIVEISLQKYEA